MRFADGTCPNGLAPCTVATDLGPQAAAARARSSPPPNSSWNSPIAGLGSCRRVDRISVGTLFGYRTGNPGGRQFPGLRSGPVFGALGLQGARARPQDSVRARLRLRL